jgi:GT2 family glycosyltransferase
MITASVVTFHTSYVDLKRLLDCVLHSSIDIFFIIDNSSNDSLREFASLSDKIVYIHSDNLGFGSGHNIAIRRSIELGAQYHAVINPDIYWEGDVAKLLAGFMDKQEDCGLVIPTGIFSICVSCCPHRWICSGEDSSLLKLIRRNMMLGLNYIVPDMLR